MTKTYVKFEENGTLFDKPYFRVETLQGDSLGWINYFHGWRQYVFGPEPYTEFSAGCLRDIASKLESLNKPPTNQGTLLPAGAA